MTSAYPEAEESLFSLVRAPLIWAVHFVLCYLVPALYCAKLGGPRTSLLPARVAIAGLTFVAAAALTLTAWRGLRRYRRAPRAQGRDRDASRSAFMGYIDLLLSILSLVAVIMSALPALIIRTCE